MNKWKIQDIQRGVGGFRVIDEYLGTPAEERPRQKVFMSMEAKFLSETSLTLGKVMKRLRGMAENFVDKHNYAIDDELEKLNSLFSGEIRTKKGPFTLIIEGKIFPFKILKFTERLTAAEEPDNLAVDFVTQSGLEATLILKDIGKHDIDFLVE